MQKYTSFRRLEYKALIIKGVVHGGEHKSTPWTTFVSSVRVLSMLYLLFLLSFCNAQDTSYAHDVMYELSSKKYHGRGYYKRGAIKASKYIARKMAEIGLEPWGQDGYYQSFPMQANVIKKSGLWINGIRLRNGIQFLPDCGNSSTKALHICSSDDCGITILEVFKTSKVKDLRKVIEKSADVLIVDTIQRGASLSRIDVLMEAKRRGIKTIIWMSASDFNYSVSRNQNQILSYHVAYDKLPEHLLEIADWKNIKTKCKANVSQKRQKNVLGLVKGENSDSTLIVCGHYDHLGQVGKEAVFFGANDNACGIAMLLDIAKYFKTNTPKYNVLIIAFAGEEAGLIGSRYYVEHPRVSLSKTKFVLNLDLVGTGHKGMTVVNATVFPNYFKKLTDVNDTYHFLPQITRRGKAANSDHYFFTEAGVPSFFGYFQGERTSYHDVFDIPESLPLDKYIDGRSLFIKFLEVI